MHNCEIIAATRHAAGRKGAAQPDWEHGGMHMNNRISMWRKVGTMTARLRAAGTIRPAR
jgi:hypothetical protein